MESFARLWVDGSVDGVVFTPRPGGEGTRAFGCRRYGYNKLSFELWLQTTQGTFATRTLLLSI